MLLGFQFSSVIRRKRGVTLLNRDDRPKQARSIARREHVGHENLLARRRVRIGFDDSTYSCSLEGEAPERWRLPL